MLISPINAMLSRMQAVYIKSLTKLEDLPKIDRPHIAMVGRSNVGKSTLINHLVQQKNLARVSAESGRTKTINLFEIDRRYYLVDLPGYGYAKTSKEKQQAFAEILSNYLSDANQIKLIFLIIDARIGPTELDHDMLDQLATSEFPIAMVLNKVDKLSKSELARLTKTIQGEYPGMQLIPHSSMSTIGRGEILQTIEKVLKK